MGIQGDGHTGSDNKLLKQGANGCFDFRLSYLVLTEAHVQFVVHANIQQYPSAGYKPWDFLQQVGFSHHQGSCKFLGRTCLYGVVADVHASRHDLAGSWRVQQIHQDFDRLVEKCDSLYKLADRFISDTHAVGFNPALQALIGEPRRIRIDPSAIPAWIGPLKFSDLKAAEEDRDKHQRIVDDLSEYLVLTFGDGEQLELAVVKSLKFLGLEADVTQKGETVDILASTPDGAKRFAVEVTGVKEGLKKDSKKLVQVTSFHLNKEHAEKIIIVANTFKALPVEDRAEREHVTPPALDLLTKLDVLFMTGWDLYQIVRDVREDKVKAGAIVARLYDETGSLSYSSPA